MGKIEPQCWLIQQNLKGGEDQGNQEDRGTQQEKGNKITCTQSE
jgi:hypothetical protein